MIQASAVGSK